MSVLALEALYSRKLGRYFDILQGAGFACVLFCGREVNAKRVEGCVLACSRGWCCYISGSRARNATIVHLAVNCVSRFKVGTSTHSRLFGTDLSSYGDTFESY